MSYSSSGKRLVGMKGTHNMGPNDWYEAQELAEFSVEGEQFSVVTESELEFGQDQAYVTEIVEDLAELDAWCDDHGIARKGE
jgi:hypothetical protein